MKPILRFAAFILLIGISFYISCKKEYSCEGCRDGNKPPIAIAGSDQVITLPTDSVSLDGSSSSDPDGTISSFLWTKISGPVSFNIRNTSSVATVVKNLAAGVYRFELKVTDNGGLSAKDTMQVIVDSVVTTNHPPIANAGADQTITLPTNTVNLNGSGSSDPDNNITSYAWTKISGPSSFNIANANAVQTQLTNLIQGIYQFELKVTDAGGLFSKDTMQVIVNDVSSACSRPLVPAQLTPFGNLSKARTGIVVAAAGTKILFAGGFEDVDRSINSTRVDIYDTSSHLWSTAEMSIARSDFAAVSFGDKIYLAGGFEGDCQAYCVGSKRIDIYDVSNNSWSVDELSIGRGGLAATASGNKLFFGPGMGNELNGALGWKKVDIYNTISNTWSFDSLSQGRIFSSATSAGNKVYFAGGWINGADLVNGLTSRIDIYDNSTNTWSVSSMNETNCAHGNIAVGNKIYWIGGIYLANINGNWATDKVEIRDINTQTSTFTHLCKPNSFSQVVLKDNKIISYPGGYGISFEIFDLSNSSWSIGVLNQNVYGSSIISVNNKVYVAGGEVNGVLSSHVWKLEF